MSRATRYASQGLRLLTKTRSNLPSYIILFVTSKCNSRCNHCFYWKDLNAHKNELSLEEIKNLSKSLGKVSNLAISGGEPLLREDLPEICEAFSNNNKATNIHIPTNGLAPKLIKERMESVLKKTRCGVTAAISLDGLKETHDSTRGVPGNFEAAIETYKELADLKLKYPHLKVLVNTVISNKNHKEIVRLVTMAKDQMPDLDGYGFDWIRGDPKNKEYSLPSLKDMKELIPFIKKTREHYLKKTGTLRNKIELGIRNYLSDLKFEIIRTQSQAIPCRAGDMFAVIYPQGEVALCELLPQIGNLREADIKTIWNSEKAEEQRKSIKSKKCWCTHGCFQPTNAMLSPKSYPKILRNIIKG